MRVHVLKVDPAARNLRVVLARPRAVARRSLGLAVSPVGVAASALVPILQREVLVAQAKPPALRDRVVRRHELRRTHREVAALLVALVNEATERRGRRHRRQRDLLVAHSKDVRVHGVVGLVVRHAGGHDALVKLPHRAVRAAKRGQQSAQQDKQHKQIIS